MALSSSQIASRLFKKSVGAGETLVSRQFFEEPKLGKDLVFTSQIWSQSDLIPTTAPVLSPGASAGVVQYFQKELLSHVSGSTNLSYYSSNLVDSIPFNFGDGTYNYTLYKNDGTTIIAFGDGDWLVDNTAGLLTFYGTLPSGVSSASPPKISFYKYIGSKGFGVDSGVGTILGVTAGAGLSGGGTAGFISLNIELSNSKGLTFSSLGENGTLEAAVDNTTIGINNSGLLYAISGASVPKYQTSFSLNTTGDGSSTGLTLSFTASQYSRVEVFVNGHLQILGDGVKNNVDCYFSADSGVSAKNINSLTFGDTLYWNGIYTGFDLSTSDAISIIYEKN